MRGTSFHLGKTGHDAHKLADAKPYRAGKEGVEGSLPTVERVCDDGGECAR